MPYSIIQPPFTLQFREMSKAELKAYGTWFHNIVPQRLSELTNAVRATPGYESWEPDQSPASLDTLARWSEGQVATRKKGDAELEETRARLTFPIEIPEDELTNRTLSLAMDIGMYFAQVVLQNVPGTRWDQQLGSKTSANYGQPVIVGLGTVPLNPVRIAVTAAYVAADRKPVRLRELYDTWANMRR